MITLKTGVPGSGKTLSAVHELMQAHGKQQDRCVLVHGVKNLVVPHRKLPVKCLQGGQKVERKEVIDVLTGERDTVPVVVEEEDPGSVYEVDWSQVPDGALVLVDEAQRVFPMRGAGQRVPPHVAFLNTHRHRGIDIWVITQHPKLIDNAVRRLVGKHQHYRRMFGGQRAVCYEWDSCSDGLQFGSATKGLFSYPKKAFSYYHSAEVHTKQKFSLPVWLIVPVLAIPLGVVALPRAYSALHGATTGKGIGTASTASTSPQATRTLSASAQPASGPASAVPGMPAAVASAPKALGCMVMAERCLCVDDGGTPMQVNPAACQVSAREYGQLVPYPQAVSDGRASAAPAVAHATDGGQDQPGPVAFGFNAGDYRDRQPGRHLDGYRPGRSVVGK